MNRLREFAKRFRMLTHRSQFDADLEEEMRLHLELRRQEQLESGMTADDARAAALRKFGNVTALRERSHAAWGWEWFEHVAQDFRYGLRMLRKSPGFTAVALLSLALGIGANTAIFSVVYAVLLKPLPYANAEQLFAVFEARPQEDVKATGWSYPNFEELRERNRVFSEVAAAQEHQLTLTGRGEPTARRPSLS